MKETIIKLEDLITKLDLLVGTLPTTTLLDDNKAPVAGEVMIVDDDAYAEFSAILNGLEEVEEKLKAKDML